MPRLLPVLLAAASLQVARVGATPPGIPSTSVAETQLEALTVKEAGASSDYDRDLFPHWISQGEYVDLLPIPRRALMVIRANLLVQLMQHARPCPHP
jgi:hypothetical protein